MCLLLNQKALVAQRSGMHEIGRAWVVDVTSLSALLKPGHFLGSSLAYSMSLQIV